MSDQLQKLEKKLLSVDADCWVRNGEHHSTIVGGLRILLDLPYYEPGRICLFPEAQLAVEDMRSSNAVSYELWQNSDFCIALRRKFRKYDADQCAVEEKIEREFYE